MNKMHTIVGSISFIKKKKTERMLDFYLIKDDQPNPDYPEQSELEFAGGLDLKTHSNLQKKGLIDDHYDYFSDFRWDTTFVKQLKAKTKQSKFENDSDVQKLIDLINKAQLKESGLIAYCD